MRRVQRDVDGRPTGGARTRRTPRRTERPASEGHRADAQRREDEGPALRAAPRTAARLPCAGPFNPGRDPRRPGEAPPVAPGGRSSQSCRPPGRVSPGHHIAVTTLPPVADRLELVIFDCDGVLVDSERIAI